jgi:hypothetical protein
MSVQWRILCLVVLPFICLLGFLLPSVVPAEKEDPTTESEGPVGDAFPVERSDDEQMARRTADAEEARQLYESLAERERKKPAGVRASLWLGRYLYDAQRIEEALVRFEAAREYATDPEAAEAIFWCEQARLLLGHEPLAPERSESTSGFWETMQEIVGIDRAIRQGRRDEAEGLLLSIEGAARREGILGLCLARWGSVFRLGGEGRVRPDDLHGWVTAAIASPERLDFETPTQEQPRESWTVVFGNFLDEASALARRKELIDAGLPARVVSSTDSDPGRHRVVMGPFGSEADADSAMAEFDSLTSADYLIQRTQ